MSLLKRIAIIPLWAGLVLGMSGCFEKKAADPTMEAVWISRPDGSLQCDDKEKHADASHDPIAQAKADLEKAGVKVLDSQTQNDGAMRAQVCGIATGNEVRLRIPKADLEKAKALHFTLVP